MALCIECNADYIRGITVCPACGRELEPETAPAPPPAAGFVPFLTTGYPEGMAAAASLEAAGLETRLVTQDFHAYLAMPMYVTVLVRERDLDAASAALRKPAPPRPAPDGPRCATCGAAASVHETERRGQVVGTTDYCAAHASKPIPVEPCETHTKVDDDVLEAVIALNVLKDVRTVCSCSGSHRGAGEGFISMAPIGNDAAASERFDAFVTRLRDRVLESDLSGRVQVVWSAVHGAEINLIDRDQAAETWDKVARLIADLR